MSTPPKRPSGFYYPFQYLKIEVEDGKYVIYDHQDKQKVFVCDCGPHGAIVAQLIIDGLRR